MNNIEIACSQNNVRMTSQRKIIAQVIEETSGHPNVEDLYKLANSIDSKISLATVYRTLKLFEKYNIIKKLELGEGKARYETVDDHQEHFHLIDSENGDIVEFYDESIQKLAKKIAKRLGYQLDSFNIELHGKPLKQKNTDQ